MEIIDLIDREKILNYEIGLKNGSLNQYYQFFKNNSPEQIGEIEKEYFHVFVQDTWALLELQKDYKSLMIKQDVMFKKWRQLFLEIIINHEQIKNNTAFFNVSPIKNFIVATIFVKKIVQWFVEKVNLSEFIQVEFTEKSDSFYRTDNKYIHEFNHIFEKIILNTIEQITAAEQLLGDTFWAQLNPHEIGKLFKKLEEDHFSQVLFLKNKMSLNDLVTIHKKNVNISNSTLVFCVQQDYSMQRFDKFQIALALTLLELSKQFHYNFIYLPFAENIEKETVALKGEFDVHRYFEMSEGGIRGEGAIHYKKALNFAFTLLKLELSSASGKICLLCNEQVFDYLPTEDYWKNAVMKFKSEKDIEITVIYIGDTELLADIWFADRVIPLENLIELH